MTTAAVFHNDASDSRLAGVKLARQIADDLGPHPDAVIVFASAKHNGAALLEGFHTLCSPGALVGGSSAGEFANGSDGDGHACAVAISSTEMRFSASLARSSRGGDAARALADGFQGNNESEFLHHTAFVLADALGGQMEALVHELTERTGCRYQLFGGGVGGDAQFSGTRVFFGRESLAGSAVALEILSNKPVGIGLGHSWTPVEPPMRVTEASDTRIVSLNAMPAEQIFREHAQKIAQPFDREAPIPFFLHNVLGIVSEDGHKVRMPLAVRPDQSIACGAEVPTGAKVCFMVSGTADAVCKAAAQASREALSKLGTHRPLVALAFDCVTTRMRLGIDFRLAVEAIRHTLEGTNVVGCNTIGQICRVEGQFGDFHNCTSLVCVLPA